MFFVRLSGSNNEQQNDVPWGSYGFVANMEDRPI